jgi:hypothetical protein
VTGGLSHLQRYGPSGIPDMAACRFVNNSVLLLSRINGSAQKRLFLGKQVRLGRSYLEIVSGTANRRWLKSGLISNYVTIEGLMNERDTKAGRKNQILFALGRVEQETFRKNQIEEIVRNEFPRSTRGVTLDIAGILSRIAAQEQSPVYYPKIQALYPSDA